MVLVVFCTLCPDMDMIIFVISYHVSRMSNRQLPSYPKQFNAYPTLLLTEQTGVRPRDKISIFVSRIRNERKSIHS